MEPKYFVAWECRPNGHHTWVQRFQLFHSKADAMRAHNDALPGEGGSFGPVEYRRVMYGEILSYQLEA